MRKYEALILLNAKNNKEGYEEITQQVAEKIEKEKGEIEETKPLGQRDFAYESRHKTSGYYVNYLFSSSPESLQKIKASLKLDPNVHLQYYQRKN